MKFYILFYSETPKRRSNTRTDEATMEEIKELTAMMSASDWRDRYKGITTLLEMCEMNSQLVSSNVIKVCLDFITYKCWCISQC